MGGLDAAEHHVGVGDGEGAAPAVAGGSGVGAGRVGADAVAAAVEVQDGAATGRDGVDAHHRRTHPDPGDLGSQLAFELSCVVRHIGGGAAHVEADDPVVAGLLRGADHADDASGRPGEDGVLAAEAGGFAQAAVGLEEHQPDPVEAGGDLVDVPAEDGREAGVDDRGVAPGDEPDQRADLVGAADLGEARLPGRLRDGPFVRGVAVAVHQDDGGAAQALGVGGAQLFAYGAELQGPYGAAVGVDAFGDLDHPLVDGPGQDDVPVEEARPVLVGDPQRVPEALGDQQDGRFAPPLQQGVGGDGGAHPDGGDPVGGHRFTGLQAEEQPDSGDSRVVVAAGVVGEELAGDQPAVGAAAHDVGEGAAPVDPELPASGHGAIVCPRP